MKDETYKNESPRKLSYATTDIGLAIALIDGGDLKLLKVEKCGERQVQFIFSDPLQLAKTYETNYNLREIDMPIQDVMTIMAYLRKQIYECLGWKTRGERE